MNRSGFSRAAEQRCLSSSTTAPTAAGRGLLTGPQAPFLLETSRDHPFLPLYSPQFTSLLMPTTSIGPPAFPYNGLKVGTLLSHQGHLSHQEARPGSPENNEVPAALPTQNEGTEAEPGAGGAAPARTGHLTSPTPFFKTLGAPSGCLNKERAFGTRGAPCRQLFTPSPFWEPFVEPPPPGLTRFLPSGCASSFGLRLQKTHAPHICIFSCDLRSPACTFSISPFLPAPDSDLPDLPYLFVRESLMNVSASVPTAAFAARALVFQG